MNFYIRLCDFLGKLGIGLVLSYPLLTSLVTLLASWLGVGVAQGLAQSGASGDAENLSFLNVLLYWLKSADSGAYSEGGRHFLEALSLLVGLFWLAVPRTLSLRLKRLVKWWVAILLVGWLSALFGGDWRLSWDIWFLWVAWGCLVIPGAYWLEESGRSGGRRLVGWGTALGSSVILLAWVRFILGRLGGMTLSMSGAFFQTNLFSCFVLISLGLTWGLVADLLSADDNGVHGWTALALGALLLALPVSALYFAFNRTAWLVAAFISALALAGNGSRSVCGWQLGKLVLACAAVPVGLGVLWITWAGYNMWGLAVGALLAGAGCFILLKSVRAWQKWALLLALTVAFSLASVVSIRQVSASEQETARFEQRWNDAGSAGDSSGLARLSFYRAACRKWWDSPYWGGGPGTFARWYPHYQDDLRWYSRNVHSLVLELLAEWGTLAALCFLLGVFMSASTIVKIWRAESGPESAWRLGLTLAGLAFLLHAQLDIDSHSLVLLVWGGGAWIGAWCIPGPSPSEERLTATVGEEGAEPPDTVDEAEQLEETAFLGIHKSMWAQYGVALTLAVLLLLHIRWSSAAYLMWYADRCAEQKHYWQSIKTAELACTLDSLNDVYMTRLVSFWNLKGQDEQSLPQMEQYLRRACYFAPHSVDNNLLYAEYLLQTGGDLEQASQYVRTAESLDAVNRPQVYFLKATILAQQGQREQARNILLQAVKKYPVRELEQMFDFRRQAIESELAKIYLALGATEPDAVRREAYLREACRCDSRAASLSGDLSPSIYAGAGAAKVQVRSVKTTGAGAESIENH